MKIGSMNIKMSVVPAHCNAMLRLTSTITYDLPRIYVLSKDNTLPVRRVKHSALMSAICRDVYNIVQGIPGDCHALDIITGTD